MVKIRTFMIFFWGFLIAAAAVAGDEQRTEIEIADMHGEHDFAMVHKADDEDVVTKKHKQVRMIKTSDTDSVTIISGNEIDDDTRAALEKVLKDAGKDGEIIFIDGTELSGDERVHGRHEMRIIKKELDVTN